MPTIEEMNLWSVEEILAELERLLPEGWLFRHIRKPSGLWKALVIDLRDEKKPLVMWEGDNIDERLLLFDVYGWLWIKQEPPGQNSAWRLRRGELTKEAVTQRVATKREASDPEDLDPKAVASLYKIRNQE
jgi:hypothetical protein